MLFVPGVSQLRNCQPRPSRENQIQLKAPSAKQLTVGDNTASGNQMQLSRRRRSAWRWRVRCRTLGDMLEPHGREFGRLG